MEEKEIEDIKKETKKLLDEFSKALSSVKADEESNVEREEDRRDEGEGKNCDSEFRKIMLENAPNKSEDFIIAEKKTW
jgi:predicted Asp-tRNA(Asn)/Glu-tRNA(Gln) amidotransferase subunit C